MAEPGFTHVIEIENGIGEPPYLPLTLGHELAPVSVGKEGMWQIQAPSILDVHGYLYYDGASLFVQSADGERPILVDASEVGTSWTSVDPPCRLKLGDIYLRFRDITDEEAESKRFSGDDATLVRPDPPVQLEEPSQSVETIAMPEPPVKKPERPFKPGELVIRNYDDSASTQVADLAPAPPTTAPLPGGDTTGATLVRGRVVDETQVERTTNPPRRRIAPAPPKPAPGTKSPLARPRAPSMPAAAPPMPPPAPPPPQLAPEPMPPAAMGMTHAMAPAPGLYPPLPPVDPTAVMAPLGPPPTVPPGLQSMPGSPYAPMHPPVPPPRQEPGLNTLMGDFRRFSPVKKAAILAFPFVLVAIFYISYYEPPPKTPEATAPSASAPQASATIAPHPSQAAPSVTPAPVAVQPTVAVQPAVAVDAGGRTLERRAVDAVASGGYAEAARLYDQLADGSPNRDEAFKYREAARILRARMDAAAP